jgi:hypothetical protein
MEAFEQDLGHNFDEYTEIKATLMENLYENKDGLLYEVYRFEADERWRRSHRVL